MTSSSSSHRAVSPAPPRPARRTVVHVESIGRPILRESSSQLQASHADTIHPAPQDAIELEPLGYATSSIHLNPFENHASVEVEEEEEEMLLDSPMPPTRRISREATKPGYISTLSSLKSTDQSLASVEDSGFDYIDLLPGGDNAARPVSEYRRSMYPPAGFYDIPQLSPPSDNVPQFPSFVQLPRPPPPPVRPSFKRLFTLTSWKDRSLFLLPAVISALGGSVVPPYMTLMIGDAFSALAAYPSSGATAEQAHALMSAVGTTSIKFTVAGLVSIILGYIKQVMWVRFSESVAVTLRLMVFEGVACKPLEWFDLGMGMKENDNGTSETIGAGGLMAKFARETDDVRMATGVPSGTVVQSIATFCFCLGLALYKQWALTLVTLSAVPLMVLLNVVTQALVHPMYSVERGAFAEASTEVERSTSAISTVKAFNAQDIELGRFYRLTTAACDSLRRQATVWAVCLGGSQAIMLSMFVIGFWYGSKLVADSTTSVATVMTVFWATLLASGNLQSIVPQLSFITKGKMSLASLLTVIQDEETDDSVGGSRSSNNKFFGTTRISTVSSVTAKVRNRPARCRGEFDFRDVRFAYPSRPDVRVLRGITLFLPAGETTFIVGGSGSGKSTVAQLLLRLYKPNSGEIVLDTKSLDNIPEDFTREHIAAVQQGCILFDMSVHDNVAMGVVGAGRNWLGRYRDHTDISRDEVIEACKMAFIHDFIMSLPHGYDTKLGTGGSLLSGGQRQRLAIARARIRDPTVLILDEATSALDATSRVVVFDAMKEWRANRTTIVITHDLSQIGPEDFVYVMKNGVVAEQGFRFDLMGLSDGVFTAMAAEQAVQPLPIREDEQWQDGGVVHDILEAEDTEEPHVERVRAPALSGYYNNFEDFHRRTSVRASYMPDKRAGTVFAEGNHPGSRGVSMLFHSRNLSTGNLGSSASLGIYGNNSRSSVQLPIRAKVGGRSSLFGGNDSQRRIFHGANASQSSVFRFPNASRSSAVLPNANASSSSIFQHTRNASASSGLYQQPNISAASIPQQANASRTSILQPWQSVNVTKTMAGESTTSLTSRINFAAPPVRAGPLTQAQRRLSWAPQDLGNGAYRQSVTGGVQLRSSVQGSFPRPMSVAQAQQYPRPMTVVQRPSTIVRTTSDTDSEATVVGTERKSASSLSDNTVTVSIADEEPPKAPIRGVFSLVWYFLPTIPGKPMLLLGLVGAIGSGALTPIWSSFISKLITLVGTGNTSLVAKKGGALLGICFAQGFAVFLQEFCLQRVAATWTASLRTRAFERVLDQDNGWFDEPRNAPARLVQSLVKDVDDIRYLVATILPRMVVVVVMIGLGMIWAMAVGWQLTLVGLGIAPFFAFLMVMSNRVAQVAEAKNKLHREAVARTFYESIANIRGIRAMALETSFSAKFNKEIRETRACAVDAVLRTAVAIAFATGMPLFVQALMNYVGAIFVKQGTMTYATMLEVYTLVLFSLTFASQMLSFMNLLTKTKVASRDFDRFLSLSLGTNESKGHARFPIKGTIAFDRVNFAYPTRPDMPVLRDFSLKLHPGESVAIVGPSGCGKSTVAALLQRLYEPTAGRITVAGTYPLTAANVPWLRSNIAVVSQSANLFDASVADNIAYGTDAARSDIVAASIDANIHDFVQSLPEGYETALGENAGLISGGQAQRLQIARALVRRSPLLILDECTSALDVDNQRAVLDTIEKVKANATTLFITHSTEAMRRCDRVVVLDSGRVAEDGPYEDLIRRGGVFAKLMQSGEWE